jgi:hypothetical protein
LFCQKVEILKQANPGLDYRIKNKSKHFSRGFIFLNGSIDTINYKFVASIKIGNRKGFAFLLSQCVNMYVALRSAANNLGANAFKITDFSFSDSSKYSYFIADTYFISDSVIESKQFKLVKNFICIFPDEEYPKTDITFKFNKKIVHLNYHEYFQYFPQDGEKIDIAYGLTGYQHIVWSQGQPAMFLDLEQGGLFSWWVNFQLPSVGALWIKTLFNKVVTIDESNQGK